MTLDKVLFASGGSDRWRTPRFIFDTLHLEFNFTHDLAADKDNALVQNYYSLDNSYLDAVLPEGSVGFCNPPWGRNVRPKLNAWCRKFVVDAEQRSTIVALLPARVDTKPWHESIIGRAAEIRLIKGRVTFDQPDGTLGDHPAPFPVAIVVWLSKKQSDSTKISSWNPYSR